MKAALERLPEDINKTYEIMLLDSPKSIQKILRRVLLLVSFSARPEGVTLTEVAEFAVIDLEINKMDPDDRYDKPEGILPLCKSFCHVSGSRNYVTLAHYTVKEYLVSEDIQAGNARYFAMRDESANMEIASIILTYLGFEDLSPILNEATVEERYLGLKGLVQKYPLSDYAVTHWKDHAELSSSDIPTILERMFPTWNRWNLWGWWMLGLFPPESLSDNNRLSRLSRQKRIEIAQDICWMATQKHFRRWLEDFEKMRTIYLFRKTIEDSADTLHMSSEGSLIKKSQIFSLGILLLNLAIGECAEVDPETPSWTITSGMNCTALKKLYNPMNVEMLAGEAFIDVVMLCFARASGLEWLPLSDEDAFTWISERLHAGDVELNSALLRT